MLRTFYLTVPFIKLFTMCPNKEYRKKNREKRKVFRLHTLLISASLILNLTLLILDVDLGFDMIYFLLFTYLILSLIFDKDLQIKIIDLFKKGPNNLQNDDRS